MPTPTVTGQTNDFTRVATGLFSLDHLFENHNGQIGFPGNTITEWYGPPGIGKSTISTFLAARMSASTGGKRMVIADLEAAYDLGHLVANVGNAGFEGEIHLTELLDGKGKARSHEDVLMETLKAITLPDTNAVIVDSVGAVIPQAEMDNPLGAANMGRRGQLMAQFSRKALYFIRNATALKWVFLVNHQYDALGKIGQRVTPGGTAKSYAASMRITMYNKERFDYGDIHVALRTDKLRMGGVRREARGYVYLMPNYGVSLAMTAVFDCLIGGLAQRKSSGIALNGKNYGRLKTLRDKVESGDTEWADDFTAALLAEGFTDTTPETETDDAEA